MGIAKQKQRSQAAFLKANPICAYCGDTATTVDHCPPRTFFIKREWPETYEFPSCKPCNEEGRSDEQVLAVLIRIKLSGIKITNALEWEKLLQGVANNNPDIAREWIYTKRNETRKYLRKTFGELGDEFRRRGYGALNIGPLTREAINRFSCKLGRALYWYHMKKRFSGTIHVGHINGVEWKDEFDKFEPVLSLVPNYQETFRSNHPISDQFSYRWNVNVDSGLMLCICRFSEQFIFHIAAGPADWDKEFLFSKYSDNNFFLRQTIV